ncbi:MAG: hypothetical protein WCW30_05275 [Candidatus Gracilibacteria bacterium]
MRNPSLSTKSLGDSIRSILFLLAGMALVLGTPFVVAAPPAMPPDGTVIPNFSAIAVSTYTTAVDYNASSGIWVGSASKTTGAASTPSTGAYVYATNAGRLVAQSTTQSSSISGINRTVATGQSGVLGSVMVTVLGFPITSSGSLGYRDSTGLYGVYTSGAAKVGSLYVNSTLYADSLSSVSGDFTINASGTTEITGHLTADDIGNFYVNSRTASAGFTSTSMDCDTGGQIISCGGYSTVNNYEGASYNSPYETHAATCSAYRSSTSGTLTVYAYCFDPSATD